MLQIYKGYVIVEVAGPQYDVYDYDTKYNRLVRFRYLQGAERWIDKKAEGSRESQTTANRQEPRVARG